MSRERPPRVPKLCQRKDGRLYATDPHLKKPVYFKSAEEYETWRTLFLERARVTEAAGPVCLLPGQQITVARFCEAYLAHARGYYQKDGNATSEVHVIKMMMRRLDDVLGERPVNRLRPRDIEAVLAHMVTTGLARRTVNALLRKLKIMFRWGVRQEVVSGETLGHVLAVESLKKGRTPAREKPKRKPVSLGHVEATLPALRPTVRDMIGVQLHGAMRPGEVVRLCAADLDRTREPWEYAPQSYKTEHLNEEDDEDERRRVWLGPQARAALAPYLDAAVDPQAPLFRTRSGRAWSVDSYYRVIQKACLRQGVPRWTPHQLRHAMATAVRHQFGAEAARAFCGHQNLKTTEVYAERDQEQCRVIAEEMG
jgi:integrase